MSPILYAAPDAPDRLCEVCGKDIDKHLHGRWAGLVIRTVDLDTGAMHVDICEPRELLQ